MDENKHLTPDTACGSLKYQLGRPKRRTNMEKNADKFLNKLLDTIAPTGEVGKVDIAENLSMRLRRAYTRVDELEMALKEIKTLTDEATDLGIMAEIISVVDEALKGER